MALYCIQVCAISLFWKNRLPCIINWSAYPADRSLTNPCLYRILFNTISGPLTNHGPFDEHKLTLILAWISNHMSWILGIYFPTLTGVPLKFKNDQGISSYTLLDMRLLLLWFKWVPVNASLQNSFTHMILSKSLFYPKYNWIKAYSSMISN